MSTVSGLDNNSLIYNSTLNSYQMISTSKSPGPQSSSSSTDNNTSKTQTGTFSSLQSPSMSNYSAGLSMIQGLSTNQGLSTGSTTDSITALSSKYTMFGSGITAGEIELMQNKISAGSPDTDVKANSSNGTGNILNYNYSLYGGISTNSYNQNTSGSNIDLSL